MLVIDLAFIITLFIFHFKSLFSVFWYLRRQGQCLVSYRHFMVLTCFRSLLVSTAWLRNNQIIFVILIFGSINLLIFLKKLRNFILEFKLFCLEKVSRACNTTNGCYCSNSFVRMKSCQVSNMIIENTNKSLDFFKKRSLF